MWLNSSCKNCSHRRKNVKNRCLEPISSPWHFLERLTFCKYYLTFLHLCCSRSDNLIDRWKNLMAYWLSVWFFHIYITSAALLPSEVNSQRNQMKEWLWICEHVWIFFWYVCINGSVLLWRKVVLEREIYCSTILSVGRNVSCSSGAVCKQKLFLLKFKYSKQSHPATKNFLCMHPTCFFTSPLNTW